MKQWMKCLVGLYVAALGISLIGCSSDNIPKGTIRAGIGVPTSISLRVLPSDTVLEGSVTPVIATVKDELGNPAEGNQVIFTTNVVNQNPQQVALAAGTAQANFTFDIADPATTVPFVIVQITALVADISTTTNVTVINLN